MTVTTESGMADFGRGLQLAIETRRSGESDRELRIRGHHFSFFRHSVQLTSDDSMTSRSATAI